MPTQITKKYAALLSLCILVLWLPLVAAADPQQIGIVLTARGNVYAQSEDNQKRALARKSPIYLLDMIISQDNSFAQIRLKDDSLISIQPNTKFMVETFNFDPKQPKKSAYVGKLVMGALVNLSGQGNPENYKLTGPVTTIGFRGTGVSYSTDGKQDKVGIFSGAVDVHDSKQTRQLTYTTNNYRQITVRADGVIKPSTDSLLSPVPLPKGKLLVSGKKTPELPKQILEIIDKASNATKHQS